MSNTLGSFELELELELELAEDVEELLLEDFLARETPTPTPTPMRMARAVTEPMTFAEAGRG